MSEITSGVLTGSQATFCHSPDDSPCGTTAVRKVFKSAQNTLARPAPGSRTRRFRLVRSPSGSSHPLRTGETYGALPVLRPARDRDEDHSRITDGQRPLAAGRRWKGAPVRLPPELNLSPRGATGSDETMPATARSVDRS
ncbi:hypothetical protein D7294_28170 [Streptomyces hoynatensis]|uniref:Uncharacterized protein n=1 Tax=Streptomyces hoynatensis TaxID=1141874 RepID=A0A3A9YMN3_9ACTN|nr:hypothetical protein D7294_28170 [Streptomyces hoynatensis]